jgi:hypothetical protein
MNSLLYEDYFVWLDLNFFLKKLKMSYKNKIFDKKYFLENKTKELESKLKFGLKDESTIPLTSKYRYLYLTEKKDMNIFQEKNEDNDINGK